MIRPHDGLKLILCLSSMKKLYERGIIKFQPTVPLCTRNTSTNEEIFQDAGLGD